MSEIQIRLPDGKTLAVPEGSSVLSVAERIGKGLARAALAGRIDGRLVDLRLPLHENVSIEIVTAKDPAGAEVIRHSAEHVMADAVKRLFPTAQVDAGRTDHSEKFQYDFLVERPFTPEDLEQIEKEMGKIIAEKASFTREVMSRSAAKAFFEAQGETLKVSRLADIPEGEEITLFRHGGFADLCRGPHVQRTDQIGAFTLIESAGSYWRGDERNPMLQRIYGTAFATRKELDEHRARLEEARRRDHRRVGVELELYHLDPIAPGSPFYLPKGVLLYNGLVDYVRSLYPRYGFQEVISPQLFRTELFKTSGHYQLFREDMFLMEGDEGEELALKPMNCPGHCHLFESRKRSYRELPLRLAEFTRLHRNERSGTLTGLSRVRAFAQDDAHVFCEPEQVDAELDRFFAMTHEVYQALGLTGVEVAVSTRPEKSSGEPADWEMAERRLVAAVERAGFPCAIHTGGAAFYGPKVECDFRDVLARPWTLSTLQIDVAMPGRFGLRYVGRDGALHQPAMLHRAILGSLERFIALYLEKTGGDFPLWLAPVQARVLPIAERHLDYARSVQETLLRSGVRAELDERSDTLGFKIREAELHKIPVMLVVGDQEAAAGSVTPRFRHRPVSEAERWRWMRWSPSWFARSKNGARRAPTEEEHRLTEIRRTVKKDTPRVNDRIREPEIRVIGSGGEQLGVMTPEAAIQKAEEEGLDLVEVAPGSRPPVCRIMNYGRYKYEQKKKTGKSKGHAATLKEVKLRPRTDDHDLDFKLRNARRFLIEGDKVKVTVMFRGREMVHRGIGEKQLQRVTQMLGTIATVENPPRMEGRFLSMILVPNREAIAELQKAERKAEAAARAAEPSAPEGG